MNILTDVINTTIMILELASAAVVAWFVAAAIAAQFVKTVRSFL